MINDVSRESQAAKEFMQSEAYKIVVERLKRDAFDAWINTPTEAVKAREDLYFLQLALAHLEQHLTAMIDRGKIAEIKAEKAKQVAGKTVE